MKILVVDDEKSIINLIRINLALEGYKVLEALNGKDAISIFKKEEPDLVLLDIMLPDLDGYEVLKELQNIDASKPIIFLTAKNQMNSKLLGLQLGAEDYITKPFDNRELVLRIRTIYRRINRYKISQKYEIDLDHNVLQHANIKVLKNERKVFIENAEIRLTYKEFNMLLLMMKNYGRVFTREELLEKVWGYDFYGNSRAVDILITRLRDKMGNYKAYIQTVYIATIKILYLNLIKKSVEYLKSESYNSQIYVMDYIKRESDFKPNDVIKNMGPFIAQYIANNLKCTTQIYNNNLDLLGESKDSEGINYNEDVVAAVNGNKCYKIYKNFQKRYILFSSPIYSGDESIGCIRYIYDLEEDMLVVKKTIYSVFLVIISLTALSLILNNILSKEILSPIIKLKKASYNLKNGIFDKKIEIDTNDELYELGETFNEMSENLEVYIKTLKEEKEKQYRFFNNATHQLKTPLTSIIEYSDLIQRMSNNKEDNMIEECGTYINTEGKRLLVLIEDILDVSKYEKNSVSIERKICNIKDDGNGIDREQIDKVFEPFFRVRGNTNPGNGLGLSICKKRKRS